MAQSPQPATPQQIQLLVGLSCLPVLPVGVWAMWYLTGYLPLPNRPAAWQAFAVALLAGAGYGLAMTRFVPVFGGQLPGSAAARRFFRIFLFVVPLVIVAASQVPHQGLPVVLGLVLGTDTVMAIVLLARALPHLSDITAARR